MDEGRILPVETYDQRQQYLQAWDGTAPDVSHWKRAYEQALQQATTFAQNMYEQIQQRWREGLRLQVEAARYRLQRELLRLLCAVDMNRSPNQVWQMLMQETGARADWLREAAQRLGYPYGWSEQQIADARRYVRDLPERSRETLRLGAGVQAALQDPRWRAQQTL
ncbi:hypothetical protein HRbin16_00645 [bacterium HR16]|nr:hypothetical protein HRbin16_00645 [bacterium HR16]